MSWYSPDEGAVAGLDKVFTGGNAPKLAGMLKALANPFDCGAPLYRDYPMIEMTSPSDREMTSKQVAEEFDAPLSFREDFPILMGSARKDAAEDLHVDNFFHAADVLSGQDLGAGKTGEGVRNGVNIFDGGFAERAVHAIESTRTGESYEQWRKIYNRFNMDSSLWEDWNDNGAKAAREKFEPLEIWFGAPLENGRQDWLLAMSDAMVQFTTVIHGARVNLNNLMGDLVEKVDAWDKEAPAASGDMGVTWLAVGSVASVATAGGAVSAALALTTSVNGMAAGIANTKNPPPSDKCYQLLKQYLDESDQLIEAVKSKVNSLVSGIRGIRGQGHSKVPRFDQ